MRDVSRGYDVGDDPAQAASAEDGDAPPSAAGAPFGATPGGVPGPDTAQIGDLAATMRDIEALAKRFYRLTVLIVTVVASVLFISSGGGVVMVVFASILVAVCLHGAARIISRVTRGPQWASVLMLVMGLVVGAVLVVHVSGPELMGQVAHLHVALKTERDALHATLNTEPLGHAILDHLPKVLGGNQGPDGAAGSGNSGSSSMDFAGSMTNVLTSTFGSVGTVVVIIIAGVYFALSPHLYANGVLRVTPVAYRSVMHTVLLTAAHTLSAWVAGQMLDMTLIGLLTWGGLSLLGMPLAMPLGFLAGTANFVPYLGTFIGATPALLVALSISPREALMVGGFYAAVQAFEGYVLSPFIQKRAVSMPPALTILSQTIFGAFLGIWGFVFASPLTAVLLAVAKHLSAPLGRNEKI
ncbi:AI-2E family transporter [Acetobacter sp. TBRC 12305]|uniref:AI-2E family transporter n=1 Tax=Acetobacter garciniae TaxID=2817435 RepID=A0A939HLQ1_9PROT|nr:AI-2E family transporter [Acetobacter garciniae]MBO1323572.1 AI-2E family transporter [Acetobacter garciniae]MBX0343261.1 AI-2E family transporter [Acetobacter garciniae]